MKPLRYIIVALGMWVFLIALPWQTLAQECPRRDLPGPDCYDESQSNPLRLAAYLIHPVGWIAEWIFYRPFHAIVSSSEETETIFGHTTHGPLIGRTARQAYTVDPKKVAMKKEAEVQEPTAERVIVKEVTVVKTVIKEVPKIVQKVVTKVVEVERLVLPDIAFRFDSAELTELGKGLTYLAVQRVKAKPGTPVKIEGHADFIGTEVYNKGLGLRRAQSVKKELQRLGVKPGRITVSSLGESKPLIDQKTNWARAANRRVEIMIGRP